MDHIERAIIAQISDVTTERMAKRVLEEVPSWYSLEDVYMAIWAEAGHNADQVPLYVEMLDNDPRAYQAFIESFGVSERWFMIIVVFLAGLAMGGMLFGGW